MRTPLIAAAALVALAACGQPQQKAPAQTPAATTQQNGSVQLYSTRNLPDWLFILRTTDGGTVHFNQRTITRENGLADIWLQVHYGRPQLYEGQRPGGGSTVVHYDTERLHYRFNCADQTFIVMERQVMGANEEIVARYEPRAIYRRVPDGGAAAHVMPIACQGG